jgi:hypothetical protein
MRIIAALCVAVLFLVFLPVHTPVLAMSPPDESQPADTVSAAKQPTTSPWSSTLPDDPNKPIKRAETVEDALAYSDGEKIIMKDVHDGDGQLSTPALYILLRRSQMLPIDKMLEEAERPNPKNFWREPERYRGRLVRLKVLYAGRVTPWTENVTPTRWWGKRDAWMMDVLVEVEKTKPPSYKRILVVMGHEPPKNLKNRQPLELVGLFYKLAKLREDAEEGDPNVKNEYPVIVAGAICPPQSDENPFKWGGTIMIMVILGLLFAFIRLKRGVSRQRAADVREYHPTRPDSGAEAATGEVDEELRRQVELHQAEKKDKDADNA